ncbi:F0F1 ATP synthase subunit B [Brackiella oedipodis]|uniref:F0F1 ATP synthase subunit B n=1 Tax=Brackiella oedipodis TaxID=124225 RepID=UPI0004919F77|nr:F0F1 ATP synthase subunit B [Brackiella oedipodis]
MNLNATLIFQVIVFFVLAWFTMKFIWPPLIKAIDERRQKIAEGLAAADKGKEDLEKAKERINEIEHATKAENQQRIADAEKTADSIVAEAREKAEAERARILEQAKQDALLEVERLRNSLRNDVADLAVKGAEQILRKEVDANAHAELLNQLKTQL